MSTTPRAANALQIFDAIIDHAHEPNVREMSYAEMVESAIGNGFHYVDIDLPDAHLIADALMKWVEADNSNDSWYARDGLREAVELSEELA